MPSWALSPLLQYLFISKKNRPSISPSKPCFPSMIACRLCKLPYRNFHAQFCNNVFNGTALAAYPTRQKQT